MKRTIFEIILGVIAIGGIAAYVVEHQQVQKSHQVVAQWQEHVVELNAQIQTLEANRTPEDTTSSEAVEAQTTQPPSPDPTIKPVESEKTTQRESTGAYDFRETTWGMSRNEVVASEGEDPLKEGDNIEGLHYIVYTTTLLGGTITHEVFIIYYFIEDQLFGGRYNILTKHSNNNDYLVDFDALKNIITKKYGTPEEETVWKDDSNKDDKDRWGMAVKTGDLEKYAAWETPTTEITLQLKGDNYKINFAIRYGAKDETLKQAVENQQNKAEGSAL